MTYNTNPQIWDSPASRKAYPRLSVSDDGDVITPTSEVVARFLSAGEAKRILRFAGWHFSGPHGWTDSASTLASADMPASPEPDWAVLGPRLAAALKGAQQALRKALPHCPADEEHNGDSVFVGEWLDEVNEVVALLP